MAEISWPEGLPNVRLTTYSGTSNPRQLRTEMESGRDRVTQLSSSRIDYLSASIIVSQSQFDIFLEFFEDTSTGGTAWFDITLDTGRGATIHEARMAGGYRYKIVNLNKNGERLYSIDFKLETDERNIPE